MMSCNDVMRFSLRSAARSVAGQSQSAIKQTPRRGSTIGLIQVKSLLPVQRWSVSWKSGMWPSVRLTVRVQYLYSLYELIPFKRAHISPPPAPPQPLGCGISLPDLTGVQIRCPAPTARRRQGPGDLWPEQESPDTGIKLWHMLLAPQGGQHTSTPDTWNPNAACRTRLPSGFICYYTMFQRSDMSLV